MPFKELALQETVLQRGHESVSGVEKCAPRVCSTEDTDLLHYLLRRDFGLQKQIFGIGCRQQRIGRVDATKKSSHPGRHTDIIHRQRACMRGCALFNPQGAGLVAIAHHERPLRVRRGNTERCEQDRDNARLQFTLLQEQ